jgi:repressor LexA
LNGVTAKQARVLRTVARYIEEFGYPPSIRDICEMTGIRSSSTVYQYLEALQRKGLISRHPGRPRTIRIVRIPDPSEIRETPPGIGRRSRTRTATEG